MSNIKQRRGFIAAGGIGGIETWFDKHLTAAQIKALNTTAIEITPTPSAGYHLIFRGAALYRAAGTAYDGVAAGEDLAVKYTDKNGLQVGSCEVTNFLDAGAVAGAMRWIRPVSPASAISDITPVTAKPLVLHMLTGNIATGTAPLKVRTFYMVNRDTINI